LEGITHGSGVTARHQVPAAASPGLGDPSSPKVCVPELSMPVSGIPDLFSVPCAMEALARDKTVTFHGMPPLCDYSFFKKLKGLRTG